MIPPFAPTATQHVPNGTFTTDRYNDKTANFDDFRRQLVAQYPTGYIAGRAAEADSPIADTVVADFVIILDPSVPTSAEDEWTLKDGLRYRALGQASQYDHPFTGCAVNQVHLRRIS